MRLTGDKNQCTTCGEFFNSTLAFDMHRTGDYGKAVSRGKYLPSARFCLDVELMKARGMSKNYAGFWVTERMPVSMHHQR